MDTYTKITSVRVGSATDGQTQVIRKTLSTGCLRPIADTQYLAGGKVIFEYFPRILDDLDGSHQTDNRFFCIVKQA